MGRSATTGDRGVISLQIVAVVMAVAVAVTAVLVSGAPERVACQIRSAATSVTSIDTSHGVGPGTAGDPECAGTTVTPAAASTNTAGTDDVAPLTGGLTGRTFSADSVASPAIRDAAAASASDARCALAPDRGTWASKLCVIADSEDPREAADGSDLVVRCATEISQPTTGSCLPTSDDDARGHRTTITTAAARGQTRFCQPLRVDRVDPRAPNSPFTVDWACASWAGNLYHCTNTLSSNLITTARSNGLVNYTEPTTWVTDPDYRTTWPRACGSRTFPTDALACTANNSTNLAACDIRGFQGLPPRPATCAYFHPRPGEDPTNTLAKPLHCRLTTTPAAFVTPVGTRPVKATAATPCPTGRRTLKADLTVSQVVCSDPQSPGQVPGQAWTTLASSATGVNLLPDQLATSAVEVAPVGPGVADPVTTTQFTFAQEVTQALGTEHELSIPSTILHDGPPQWVTVGSGSDQPHHVFLVPVNATPQQFHQPFAAWLATEAGVDDSGPVHADFADLIVQILVGMDTGQGLPSVPATLDGTLSPSQLLAQATHLVAEAVPPEAAPVAAFAFAHEVLTDLHLAPPGEPITVDDVLEDLADAASEVQVILDSIGVEFPHTPVLQSLAALIHLGTPLTQAEAEQILRLSQGDDEAEQDFWDPVAVPDIPADQQAPLLAEEDVVLIELPAEPGTVPQICLAVNPVVCTAADLLESHPLNDLDPEAP